MHSSKDICYLTSPFWKMIQVNIKAHDLNYTHSDISNELTSYLPCARLVLEIDSNYKCEIDLSFSTCYSHSNHQLQLLTMPKMHILAEIEELIQKRDPMH